MKERSGNLDVDDDAENDNGTKKRLCIFIYLFSFCFVSSTFGPVITVLSGTGVTGQQNNEIYYSAYIDLCLEYGWSGNYNFICTRQLLRNFFYYCLTTLLLSNAIFLETNSQNNAILILFATLTFLMPTNTF